MSLVKQGNSAFKNKDYKTAVECYKKALKLVPNLSEVVRFNIELAEKRLGETITLPALEPIRKLAITALVITWDVGHNPLGRSYMLAEALERSVRNVVITGFQFPRYGDDIWQPVRNGRLPVISLPGGNMGEWLASCEKAVEKFKPDVVIACKSRLPSVELGILFKEKYGIPLIVDVDDHELSFFKDASPMSIDDIKSMDTSKLSRISEPYDEVWTRLTDSLTKHYADEVITSNVALDEEFGGTIIPHVRDEETFEPSKYNKATQRQKYGVPENAKIIMFFGTPRVHKGVGDIASAVGNISDSNVQLVVVGEAPDKSVVSQLDKLSGGKVIYLPNQPFSSIPEIIVMADLILLPQDIHHSISKYQLPAKAIDAIGMGIPLFVSGTKPLMQLVNDGVAQLLPDERLEEVIERVIYSNVTSGSNLSLRKKFLLNYSYHSAALKLKQVIERAQKNKRKPLNGFTKLKNLQYKLFPKPASQIQSEGVDIVVFWKQNDTGLYGRRSDMVIKYLASREDVRKVVVFDAPISQFDIENMKSNDALTQKRNVYIRLYEKILGKLDTSKISYNVFAHPPGVYTLKDEEGREPLIKGYQPYLKQVFETVGVVPSKSVFWFYPKISLAENLIDIFKPHKTVVDVVDDHRAWPNVSEHTKKELTNHYKQLLSKADIAFANCKPVIDSMKEFKPDIQLVPNGCEENPEIIEPKNHAMYEELKVFEGKVIGFVGNLEAKIDIPLIERIADEFKDVLIVIVGSTHANPETRNLQKHTNVRMFGVVPYENVNAIVSKFDVGIVPHKKMDLTDNMNPLKIFVYLANRVGVVTTSISNLPKSDCIFMAVDEASFIGGISKVLNKNKKLEHCASFAKDNSWSNRFSNLDFFNGSVN